MNSKSHWFLRYSLAVAVALFGWLFCLALKPIVDPDTLHFIAYPTMMVVALTLGTGPGLLVSVLSIALIEVFFLEFAGPLEFWTSFGIRSTILMLTAFYVARVGERLRMAYAQAAAQAAAAHKAEEALRQNATKYRDLVQNANCAIIRWKSDGSITFFNEYAQSLFGYGVDEILGRHVGILVPDFESTGDDLRPLVQDVVAHPERYVQNVNENVCRDGRRVWMAWTNRPVFDEQGQVAEILAVGMDITERRKAETALILQREELQTVLDSVPAWIFYKDKENRFLRVNKAFAETMKMPKEQLEGRSILDLYPREQAEAYWRDDLDVITSGKDKINVIEPLQLDSETRWAQTAKVPYRDSEGSIIGIIGFSVDITERKRTEEELEILSRFPGENPNPVLRVSSELTILYCNPAGQPLLREWQCHVGEKIAPEIQRHVKNALATGTMSEIEVIAGEQVFVVEFVPISAGGYVNLYGRDITEPKRIEEAIRKSEQQLRQAMRLNRSFTFEWRVATDEVIRAEECAEILGLTGDAATHDTGEGFFQKIHPEDRDQFVEVLKGLNPKNDTYTAIYRLLRPDGGIVILEEIARGAFDENGVLENVVGMTADITVRKRAEEALRQSREDLDRAQSVGQIGSWRLDVIRNVLTWSDENYQIFGIPQGAPLTYETFLGCIHPADRQQVDDQWRAGLAGEPYDIEHRIVANGETKWVREKAYLELDEAGNLLGGFGITQDITVRKQAEEALRRSRDRFALLAETMGALLLSSSPQRLVETLCRRVMEYLDCQVFFNFLADEDAGRLRLNAYAGVSGEEASEIEWLDYGMSVCGCAAAQGSRIVAEHIPSTQDTRTDLVRSFGIKAYACHPLLGPERIIIGTLSFGTRNRETFDEDDLALMKSVADHVAVAMERVNSEQALRHAYDELERRVKERTEELRLTSLYARSLIEASLDPLLTISPAGEITDVNQATERATGVARSKLIGSDFSDYFTEPEKAREGYQRVLAEGQVTDYPLTIRHASGTMINVLYNAAVYRNEAGEVQGVFAAARDVTQRKKAEDALRRSEALLAEAQRTAHLGGWDWNVVTGELSWSDEMYRIFGVEPQSFAVNYVSFLDSVHPDERRYVDDCVKRALEGGDRYNLDYRIVLPDKQERVVHAQGKVLFDDAHVPVRMMGTIMDITEQVRAQEEARTRQQQLIQADKMVSLGILVAGVAHEINNPNHSIMSNITALSGVWESVQPILDQFYRDFGDFVLGGYEYSESRDKLPEMFANALTSSRRIESIVTELRDFARYSPKEKMAAVNVNDVLRSAVVLVSNMIEKTTDRVSIEYANDMPPVLGNFQRIEQVLINLIQNACRAIPSRDKGIFLTTSCSPGAQVVHIEVRDEGVGIPEQDMKHLGDPFFTTSRAMGGTGLGLWVSFNIVHEHGGTLTFHSEEGEGVRAILTLPILQDPDSARTADRTRKEGA